MVPRLQYPGWRATRALRITASISIRSNTMRTLYVTVMVFVTICTARTFAQTTQSATTETTAPLLEGLGDHTFPVSTGSAQAQRYIDQGLVLAYGFNHKEAERAFREAARLDPQCAMAWWGTALVLGPHVNAAMKPEDAPRAWEALRKAQELAPTATPRERDYIAALSKRYAQNPPEDRSSLDQAYMNAMRELAKKYPDDTDAATLFAESIMDTMPWNYWLPDGKHQALTPELLAVLEAVIEKAPQHPGANHLYIHAVEAGPNPEKGLAAADRLRDIAPGMGHLVHMPAHIYLRLGFYQLASRANEEAIEADEGYLQACSRQGFYPAMYYPHNIHFLWYTSGMEGRSAEAVARAREAAAYVTSRCCADVDISQRPLPLLALSRFGRWDELLREPRPDAEHTFDVMIDHYARGIAFTHTGQIDRAIESLTALQRLAESEAGKKLDTPFLPATHIFSIAGHELGAEIARRQRRTDEWISGLRSAVEMQDQLPYMEPPYWYYPVRHNLGAALLELNRADEAEAVYRADLKRNPHNGWSLFGLSQALRAQGKTELAAEVQRQFEHAWARADVKLTNSRY
jgi:tetratricopeptide (TPR) repeat protein